MSSPLNAASLAEIATYLAARREALLNNWRTTCEGDLNLNSVSGLSREEFNDKVPFMLNLLEQRLRGPLEENQISVLAAEHGLHRWRKGYAIHELSAEMQHLNNRLLEELRLFLAFNPNLDREVMATAYECVAMFSNRIGMGSLEQYTTLQRLAASSRVEALEKTLTQLNELNQQRSDLLHRSSHDLQGSFGIIQGAASLLEMAGDSEEERKPFLDMLQRNLANSHRLVTKLIEMARLEAGQERLQIQSFHAGQLLANLVADYQPLAKERGIMLNATGPAELDVEGDPVQLQRIIQNLVLNALKHTVKGYVSVSWSRENDYRWTVSVQDSGPGLPTAGETGSLPQALAPSSDSSAAFGLANPEADAQEAVTIQASGSLFAHRGEGIGLSIVKGLCELLRASLEVESKPQVGTLFRIRLPTHWQH